jgi:hypothetical protein
VANPEDESDLPLVRGNETLPFSPAGLPNSQFDLGHPMLLLHQALRRREFPPRKDIFFSFFGSTKGRKRRAICSTQLLFNGTYNDMSRLHECNEINRQLHGSAQIGFSQQRRIAPRGGALHQARPLKECCIRGGRTTIRGADYES